jgi:hypothetical protein
MASTRYGPNTPLIDVAGDVAISGGDVTLRLSYRPSSGEAIVLVQSEAGDLPADTAFNSVCLLLLLLLFVCLFVCCLVDCRLVV